MINRILLIINIILAMITILLLFDGLRDYLNVSDSLRKTILLLFIVVLFVQQYRTFNKKKIINCSLLLICNYVR